VAARNPDSSSKDPMRQGDKPGQQQGGQQDNKLD
jgi:hypothetical protein